MLTSIVIAMKFVLFLYRVHHIHHVSIYIKEHYVSVTLLYSPYVRDVVWIVKIRIVELCMHQVKIRVCDHVVVVCTHLFCSAKLYNNDMRLESYFYLVFL